MAYGRTKQVLIDVYPERRKKINQKKEEKEFK